jgi:hypothetical protein
MASVWTGSTTSFEEGCKILARIGFKGVDLPTEQQVPILMQNGLTPAMMTGAERLARLFAQNSRCR